MDAPDSPFDPGLQPERTLLAWRRTCLSFAVASVALIHLATRPLGVLAVVLGGTGAVLALLASAAITVRYHRTHLSLHSSGGTGVDARPLAVAAAAALTLGVAALAYLATAR
jgi:uncharacterized membrane protein YidH (DUF202 family)